MEPAAMRFNGLLPAGAFTPNRAEKAARDFEAQVISQMLAPLFASVKTPGVAGGGPSEAAFASMLHEEFAKAVAARGGFGIADQVKAELIRLQSGDGPQAPTQGAAMRETTP